VKHLFLTRSKAGSGRGCERRLAGFNIAFGIYLDRSCSTMTNVVSSTVLLGPQGGAIMLMLK
jgi:hypothetical protein